MQYSKKLSYPQRTFSAIFGSDLLELLLIERYEQEAVKITDEFLEKFINDLHQIDHDKDVTLISTIIDMIYKKGLTRQDVIKQTGIDQEIVFYHHAFVLRRMRRPSICKPYRENIISLLN